MSQANALVVNIEGKGGHGAMSSEDGNVVLAVSAWPLVWAKLWPAWNSRAVRAPVQRESFTRAPRTMWLPRRAQLRGTLRTFTPDQLVVSLERLGNILDEIGDNFNVNVFADTRRRHSRRYQ